MVGLPGLFKRGSLDDEDVGTADLFDRKSLRGILGRELSVLVTVAFELTADLVSLADVSDWLNRLAVLLVDNFNVVGLDDTFLLKLN